MGSLHSRPWDQLSTASVRKQLQVGIGVRAKFRLRLGHAHQGPELPALPKCTALFPRGRSSETDWRLLVSSTRGERKRGHSFVGDACIPIASVCREPSQAAGGKHCSLGRAARAGRPLGCALRGAPCRRCPRLMLEKPSHCNAQRREGGESESCPGSSRGQLPGRKGRDKKPDNRDAPLGSATTRL